MNLEEENIDDLNIPNDPPKRKFWKFLVLMVFINLGFLAVMVRLFLVQVVDIEGYKERAKRQHESEVELKANRGRIYDSMDRLLVTNLKSYSVAVDPTQFKNKKKAERNKLNSLKARICEILAKTINTPSEDLIKKINSSNKSFVWLARGLSSENVKELRKVKAKGLILIEEPKRYALFGYAGAQLIGCTNIDNKGVSGIERSLDSILKGRPGFMIMNRDALGYLRPSAGLPTIPPMDGNSIKLTIDMRLQQIIEYELKKGVGAYNASSGTVIAMEPSTGKIKAIASWPGYNPNIPSEKATGIMRNRGITDIYEPGSTFKLITAAAALDEKTAYPDDMFNAYNGLLDYGEYKIRDDHAYSNLTFNEAMIHSSNIVFSQIAYKINSHKFYKYVRDFGFGLTLDIDLPGEISGRVKRPNELTASAKRFMGFGYGISASALQILNAYSTVANGGTLMKPYVVDEIKNPDDEVILKNKPEKVRRVITGKTAEILKDMLVGVVDEGTGSRAKIKGLKIAGKTGTAQQLIGGEYSKEYYTASFAGFFPADNPKIVIIVMLDKPLGNYYGGSTAAPIFRDIAARWMNVSEDIHSVNDSQDKVAEKKIQNLMPELRGLKFEDAKALISEFKIEINYNSENGVVISQKPLPGVELEAVSSIDMIIASPDDNDINGIMPDVRGMRLRNAISILTLSDIQFKIRGSGKVKQQIWEDKGDKKKSCTLICN